MRDASPNLYGQWLNSCTGVKDVLLTHKLLTNLVEAHITYEGSNP